MFMKVSNELQLLAEVSFAVNSVRLLFNYFPVKLLGAGPHLISFRPQARNVPLQASMTVTDG